MTVFILKLIAIITMLIDHVGAIFFPFDMVFRIIGRLSFPVFAFLIAEGYTHTKDCKKYIQRIFLFAMISQIPFYLAFNEGITFSAADIPQYFFHDLNVLFTFLFALIAIWCFENMNKIVSILVLIFLLLLSTAINTDYSYYGILLVFVFYIFKSNISKIIGFFVIHFFYTNMSYNILSFENGVPFINFLAFSDLTRTLLIITPLVSSIFILLYNGKLGNNKLKWFFYAFYPAHILILYLIKIFFVQY